MIPWFNTTKHYRYFLLNFPITDILLLKKLPSDLSSKRALQMIYSANFAKWYLFEYLSIFFIYLPFFSPSIQLFIKKYKKNCSTETKNTNL